MAKMLDELNEEQVEAATTTEGYVCVVAGAGSGKTKALTSRYVYLVEEIGISTANILCVTFTNKAANEMKKRIRQMIGDYDTGLICTFHGFCVQLLREDIHTLLYPENFMVLDTEDRDTILKHIYRESGLDARKFTYSMARDMIDYRKNTRPYIDENIVPADLKQLKERYERAVTFEDKIYYGYLYEQQKCYGLDFEDLHLFSLYILKKYPQKREKWRKRLEYIMVDEFQDVCDTQYELVEILSAYHKNLFVVGDPDQTIYSWRGAKVDYILNYANHFPAVKTIVMDKNYRSTELILKASNSLIRNNRKRIDKELKSMRGGEFPLIYYHAKTSAEEAEWIWKQIMELKKAGRSYRDITILYRSHYVSRSIEERFIREKIPYILFSGVEFYKRKEVKDVLSYLRLLVQEDDFSFLRIINVPGRNIGSKRISILQEYADNNNCSLYEALKENLEQELIRKSDAAGFVSMVEKYRTSYKKMRLSELVTEILGESGYEKMLRLSGEDERLANLAELKQAVKDYEESAGEDVSLEEYLQNVALFTNVDKEAREDSVKMMTIHTAKGLEFPYVFVAGLSEGIFPSGHTDTEDKLEEERRLAYVAYTRAENVLFISDSEGENFDGSFRYPSRFIFNTEKAYVNYKVELEEHLLEKAGRFIEASERKLRGMPLQNAEGFRPGDRVRHKVFGEGEILARNADTQSYVIQFEGMETPRNLSQSARLEKVQEKS